MPVPLYIALLLLQAVTMQGLWGDDTYKNPVSSLLNALPHKLGVTNVHSAHFATVAACIGMNRAGLF